MSAFNLLHFHPLHRSRQIRWVLPITGLLLLAALATMGTLYYVSNQDIGNEFFHAHKTISHTGQLLQRGVTLGIFVLCFLILGTTLWAFRLTRRIVRPIHTLHRALDELITGNLAVQLELHRHDEFQEVGGALNQLVTKFSSTITRIHTLADRVEALAAQVAAESPGQATELQLHQLATELNETIDFFHSEPQRIIREEDS